MQLRCPHCQNPIELLGHEALHDVCCPSCGSSFNLISGDTTQTYSESRSLGHFQLIEQLGIGAFGSVWKAKDKELDRTVAIKIPRKDQLSPQETEIFLREARTAAQLRHTNIVSVHEVGREQDTVYIVSDYIDGANLKQWLTNKRLTFREAAELCVVIAEALHAAHESGVVHRDLKPGNILMDLMGRPHITDFGLAKREAGEITMTVEGQILGTPAYMSPEQARGEGHQADRRSDLYSLGVILFELLTGELPFRGEARMLIVQILKDEPPSPRKLNARIPRDLETITLKCLSKDPARRYATAAEVAADLQRHLRGEPILARPVSQAERLVRWCQRSPTLAAMTTTIAALLIVGTVVSTYFAIRASNEAIRANGNAQRADDRTADAITAAKKEREERDRADENAKTASRHLYNAHMNLAQSAWESRRVGAVLSVLERYGPASDKMGLRGFEWYYWERHCHSYRLNLNGHTGPVFSVVFSPDGRFLASASQDQTVKLWDVTSGKEVRTLKGHKGEVWSVAFGPDGRWLASASQDQTVKLWDVTSGKEVRTLKGHKSLVRSVAFGPDGQRLASASQDQTVRVWDVKSGDELLTLAGHTGGANAVAFSLDGQLLASAGKDQTVKLWDATSGKEVRTLKGHNNEVMSVAFGANGRRLSSASEDRTVKVWDLDTDQAISTLKGHAAGVWGVAFSTDGKRLASASVDETVKLWDVASGEELFTLRGNTHNVLCLALSTDGQRLASGSFDRTVKVWDMMSDPDVTTLKGFTGGFSSVAFSVDGQRLASANGDQTVRVWEPTTDQTVLTLKGHTGVVTCVAFSQDGQRLASASEDQMVKVWDATTGNVLLTLNGHSRGVLSVALSPNGKWLASAGKDQTVKVWDAVTGEELLTLKGHTGEVLGVAFSANSQRLASAGQDQTVKVWDVITGKEEFTLRGHSFVVSGVAFSADGHRLASSSWDGTIKLWDLMSGQELLTLRGHTNSVRCVAFSTDGKRLVSGGSDQIAKIWDVTTGQETMTLKGHTNWVTGVGFSTDGTRIASCSYDQTVKVWDARPWTPELRVEREALSLIRLLRDQGKIPAEWLDAIAADQTITESVRQRALQFARDFEKNANSAKVVVKSVPPGRVVLDPALTGLIDRHRSGIRIKSSTEWTGWPASKLLDGDPQTSWFSGANDSAALGKSPWFEVTFSEPIVVGHVKVLGCTEPGYASMKLGVLEARLLLLNAKGETLQSIVASLPKSTRDLEFRFPSAVTDVRGIRFVSLKDEGDKNQFGDIALGELLISEQAIPVPP